MSASPAHTRTPHEADMSDAGQSAKSADAFRTISEVAEELDIPAHVLRFWETKFPQVNPLKRGGGRRYYRPADVALLRGIRALLYEQGLTIKGLQKIFREQGARGVAALGEGGAVAVMAEPAPQPAAAPSLRAVIARLEAVRDGLRRT
jgi:DNA-binding transcriptional MerR regulator